MRILSLTARTVRWPIAGTGAARGRGERAAVIVEARSERGAIGLGEAAPLPGMSLDTLADAEHAIAALARRVPFTLHDRALGADLAAQIAAAPPRDVTDDAALARRHALAGSTPPPDIAALARRHALAGSTPPPGIAALARHHALAGSTPPPDTAALARHHALAGSTPPPDIAALGLASTQVPRTSAASPAARFAIETALLDAMAHERGVPLAALLALLPGGHGGSPPPAAHRRIPRVPLAAVVDDPEGARRAFAAGIRCFKLKLTADDPLARAIDIAAAAPGVRLRIDANRAWPRDEVPDRLAALAALPVDYVEEPCRDTHQLLATSLPCKLALDESLAELTPDQLAAALRSPGLAAIVLKPALIGGLAAALVLAAQARRAGVAAIVSHALEGPIGTAACAEFALALGGPHAAGLAAHAAIAGWAISVEQLAADHVHSVDRPGLGFADLDLHTAIAAAPGSSPCAFPTGAH